MEIQSKFLDSYRNLVNRPAPSGWHSSDAPDLVHVSKKGRLTIQVSRRGANHVCREALRSLAGRAP